MAPTALLMAKKGEPQPLEVRAKIGLANRGKVRTMEMRARISASKQGNTYCVGRILSPATRAAISQARAVPWAAKSLAARHRWVRINFDDPGGCEYCGVQWMPLEWASLGHTYTQNRADWKRLCVRCHRRMDKLARAC